MSPSICFFSLHFAPVAAPAQSSLSLPSADDALSAFLASVFSFLFLSLLYYDDFLSFVAFSPVSVDVAAVVLAELVTDPLSSTPVELWSPIVVPFYAS